MSELHDRALNFMEKYRANHPDFVYYLRSGKGRSKSKLQQGFWFQGTNRYASVGLYRRTAGNLATMSISLAFTLSDDILQLKFELHFKNEKKQVALEIYQKIIERIQGLERHKDYYYSKSFDPANSFEEVNAFLNENRPFLDELIRSKMPDMLIKEDEFQTRLEEIESFRNPASSHQALEAEVGMNALSLILYGPPGTGKTYNTIDRAVRIAAPDEYKPDDHNSNKMVYDKLVESKQVQLTTFHQSLTYEDFIEGIKPVSNEDDEALIKYEIVPGIFKKLCTEAAFSFIEPGLGTKANSVLGFSAQYDRFVEEIEEALSKEESFELETRSGGKVKVHSISSQGNIIIKHLGGEVKYTVSKARLSRLNEAFPKMEDIKNIHNDFVSVIGGTNSTTYWAVLNAIREKNYSSDERKVLYSFEEKQEAVSSMTSDQFSKNNPKQFVLIIDEINRGNVAAILGELITLIEPDKRLGCPESQMAILPYSKEKFGVPPNLHIIGTMNTADRSVEVLDTALRRRFSFVEMPPQYDLEELEQEVAGVKLSTLLQTINGRIEKLLDKDHLIGHAYFINVKTNADLVSAFNDKITPLLQEYFYNDFAKIGMVLGKGFVQKKSDTVNFANFDVGVNGDYENREVFEIKRIEAADLKEAIADLMNQKKKTVEEA